MYMYVCHSGHMSKCRYIYRYVSVCIYIYILVYRCIHVVCDKTRKKEAFCPPTIGIPGQLVNTDLNEVTSCP